ncbi:hypothetical protein L1987_57641 [Smallanthus sonchifolius]|uniref:Uncharacterized protein n=1 Tax=Smallanthus sonchifolius TaxID=185202 RepID=A0ACB9DDV7_9ASTR|nr:hypothetical protein L1987_57641 [Smallanthus sonchifolius]
MCNKYVYDHDSRNCKKIQAAKEAADKAAAAVGSVFDLSAVPSSHPAVELPAGPSIRSDVDLSAGPSSRVVVDRSSPYARRSSGHDTVVADVSDVGITAGPSSRSTEGKKAGSGVYTSKSPFQIKTSIRRFPSSRVCNYSSRETKILKSYQFLTSFFPWLFNHESIC